MSVSALKQELKRLEVDYSHCIEKQELIDLYVASVSIQEIPSPQASSEHLMDVQEMNFESDSEKEQFEIAFDCPICYCDYPFTEVFLLNQKYLSIPRN